MISKNNPFNIRYSSLNHWIGLEGETKGFCDFDSRYHGLRAGIILLRNYVYRKNLDTVKKVVERFAPPSENNTSVYIHYVSHVLLSSGCSSTSLVNEFDLKNDMTFYYLCKAICFFETHYKFTFLEYQTICKTFNLKK